MRGAELSSHKNQASSLRARASGGGGQDHEEAVQHRKNNRQHFLKEALGGIRIDLVVVSLDAADQRKDEIR